MNISDVQTLARTTLEPMLKAFGLESVEVLPYTDWVGEDAFRVTARLQPNSPVVPGNVSLDVMVALSSALLDRGEERFPYILFDHQEEASIGDDVRPASADH